MVVAFAVDQKSEDLIDLAVLDHRAQTYHSHVVERDLDFEAAGFDFEEIKFMYVGADCPAADLFNYPYTMVRINYFVADLEVQLNTHETPWMELALRGNQTK